MRVYNFSAGPSALPQEVLKEAANKLLFDMEESEYDTLLDEFDIVLKQMKLIGEVDGIEKAEPMTFPFAVTTSYLREDEVGETLPQEEALKNARDVVDGQVRLPKVVG